MTGQHVFGPLVSLETNQRNGCKVQFASGNQCRVKRICFTTKGFAVRKRRSTRLLFCKAR